MHTYEFAIQYAQHEPIKKQLYQLESEGNPMVEYRIFRELQITPTTSPGHQDLPLSYL